ncbi:H-NS histone family protein [Burkholderia alba]|uniref:H-NS histone family protein n=1 Tax=Burkholderia alba TaxID=2683677 RepID=UPI002B05739D|nr:H-NS histone family protein [Burkholderia alba]
MATYKELLARLNDLTQQAKAVRETELETIVADIRQKIADYGLTERDLFPPRLGRPKKIEQQPKPKYRDPKTGATWTGRGRAPAWIVGKNREHFLIG